MQDCVDDEMKTMLGELGKLIIPSFWKNVLKLYLYLY